MTADEVAKLESENVVIYRDADGKRRFGGFFFDLPTEGGAIIVKSDGGLWHCLQFDENINGHDLCRLVPYDRIEKVVAEDSNDFSHLAGDDFRVESDDVEGFEKMQADNAIGEFENE